MFAKYQKILCVTSNKPEPERYNILKKNILRRFIIKRAKKDSNIIFSLFLIEIFGVDKLRINNK